MTLPKFDGFYRGLSIHAPWAWAVIYADKDIENRQRPWNYRGIVLIHQSKNGWAEWAVDEIYRITGGIKPSRRRLDYALGYIIGAVWMEECTKEAFSPWAQAGLFHYHFRSPIAFTHKVQLSGRQSIMKIDPQVLAPIDYHKVEALRLTMEEAHNAAAQA